MKATVAVRVLLLSCVWQCCHGLELGTKSREPINDGTYTVQRRAPGPTKDLSGISICLAQIQPPPVVVRFESLKTSNGSVYTRQLVTNDDLSCFGASTIKRLASATDIGACADAAADEGMNSFLWADEVCRASLAWWPHVRDSCQGGGVALVFVATEPLTPVASQPPRNVSGSVVYNSTYSATLVISFDPPDCGALVDNRGFRLGWNGTQTATVPEGVLEYSLDRRLLCHTSTHLSLWSLGADGETNSDEVIVAINRTQIFWFGLSTGDCLYLYNDDNELNYNDSRSFCEGLEAALVTEETAGGFLAFSGAWKQYLQDHPTTADDDFYVGIQYNTDQSKWLWESGLELTDNRVWANVSETANTAVNRCAYAYKTASKDWRLRPDRCSAKKYQGCLDRQPL